jgi:PAS domain S-box-containing protein
MMEEGGSSMRNSQGMPVETPETVQWLIRHSSEIQGTWLDQLKKEWGEDGSFKVALLAQEQENKKDLLSILIDQMSGNTENERKGRETVVARVRSENYSLDDFLIEMECLENSTEEVLKRAGEGSEIQILENLNHVWKRLGALLRATVQETSGVYEKIVESGARGFCLFKADGTIVATNEEMKRLLGTRSATGRALESFIDPGDRALLRELGSRQKTGKPRMGRFYLRTDLGAVIPVGAEIGPLTLQGEQQGGYLCAVDLSLPDQREREILDKFPLAVAKLTLKGEFTYMNPVALRVFGLEGWEGRTTRDIFPNDETHSKVISQLARRQAGLSDEYEIEITRPSDRKKVPVSIAAMPETDLHGEVIRSMAIVRDLSLEKVSDKIHNDIASSMNAPEMLAKVIQEVSEVIRFDRFIITQYSADMTHLRDFVSYDHTGNRIKSNIRWWPIPAVLMNILRYGEVSHIDNFEEFLNQPRFKDLKTLPEFVRLFEEGFRSSLRYPVVQQGKAIAGINLLSKEERTYGEDQETVVKKLPLDKAVLMALHYEERRELKFRLNLVQKIVSASDDVRHVAETIVDELGAHYEWEEIGLFRIDEKTRQISLLHQKARPESHPSPEPSVQALGEGVLGYVYSTGKAVNIPNVREDPFFSGLYKPGVKGMLSELCLPIVIGDKVCWLLNIEDSRQNAFSKEEMDALLGIVQEIGNLLDRVWQHHFLQAILKSTSDLVFVTNRQGRISHANPAALELKDIFTDPEAVRDAIEAPTYRTKESIKLRCKGGSLLPVLLSASELPEYFEGKVFVCKDVSVFERVKELDYLTKMYNEIAVQTQTPLSLAFGWIRRLGKETGDKEMANTLDKALKQLSKVEMTYRRLALYDKQEGVLPYTEMLLSISEVVDHVLSEFPESERNRIAEERQEKLPYLRGDLFQLTFCLEAILSCLLRYLPLDEKIDLRVFSEEGWVIMKIAGFLPPDRGPEEFAAQKALSKTIMQMALGDEVIKKFVVDNHKGKFFYRHTGGGSQAVFWIHLPAAQEEA